MHAITHSRAAVPRTAMDRVGARWALVALGLALTLSGCSTLGRSGSERTGGVGVPGSRSGEQASASKPADAANRSGGDSPAGSAPMSSTASPASRLSSAAAQPKGQGSKSVAVPGFKASTGVEKGFAPDKTANTKAGKSPDAPGSVSTDSVDSAWRLSLFDMIESANTKQTVGQLGGKPDDVVVLQLKVRKDGGFHLKSLKAGAKPESVGAAMAAVERAAPLLPPPDGKPASVKLTFLFRNDGRFKLALAGADKGASPASLPR